MSPSSTNGQYTVVAEADRDGEHFGCSFSFGLLGAGIFTYYLDYVESGTRAHYLRCNSGICSGIWVRHDKISPPNPSYPVYLFVKVTSLNLSFIRYCWGFSGQTTGSCGPDPLP
jgi:hypothetical protein